MSAGELPISLHPDLPGAERVFQTHSQRQGGYGVYLVDHVLDNDGVMASLLAHRKTLVVSTPSVWRVYGSQVEALRRRLGLDLATCVLAVDEERKSMDGVMLICSACLEQGIGRTDVLLALGGGVCNDLVTVAASLVRRGVSYVSMPTTLVAQIDAGIGIKGAVNFNGAKSYLGTFHLPEIVLVDPAFLATAPEVTRQDGIAEAIKMATIGDARLFALLEEHGAKLPRASFAADRTTLRTLLHRSITGMLEELSPNFFEELAYRRRVDFGHTFSALIEERSHYQISHGHAVSIDMALSASLSLTLGNLTDGDFERILSLLTSFGLPVTSPLLTVDLCVDSLHSAELHRGGAPNLVIPLGVGSCGFVTDSQRLPCSVLLPSIKRLERGPSDRGAAS